MAVCRFIFNLKNCWDISYPRGRDNKRSGYNLIEGDMYTFFKILSIKYLSFEYLLIDKLNNMNSIKSILNPHDNI